MPSSCSQTWMSVAVGKQSTIGFRADLQPNPGRSPNQIPLGETGIRISDQQFWLCAAADPATDDLFTSGCFRRPRPPSQKLSRANCVKSANSKPLYVPLTARNTSRLRCNELDSSFRCIATEIGTLPSESFENSNAKPRRLRTASVTSDREQPKTGHRASLDGTVPPDTAVCAGWTPPACGHGRVGPWRFTIGWISRRR